jgi:hypothetical protein
VLVSSMFSNSRSIKKLGGLAGFLSSVRAN